MPLLGTNFMIGLKSLGTEQLGEINLATQTPLWPVRSPSDVGEVVAGVFACSNLGSGGEDMIIGFENLLCHFTGRSNHDVEGSELEVHDGTVCFGQVVKRSVREVADLV